MQATIADRHMRVKISSHGFSCSNMSSRGRDICFEFAKKFIAWEWKSVGGVFTRTPVKIYASALDDRSVIRFHINSLPAFKQALADRQTGEHLIEWVQADDYEPMKFDYKIKPNWKARDYQVPYIEYLSKPEPVAKILEFQTGHGKSMSALFAIANFGQRVVAVLKPKYLEKWTEDFLKTYEDFEDQVMVVQGSKDLKLLLIAAQEDNLPDAAILISNTTLRNWITEYETMGDDILEQGYACLPEDLFSHLKAGVRLVDEAHEDFHFFFKLDTYTHVKTSISLTATLVTKDPFIERMYETQFPATQRMPKLALDRYIDTVNLLYRLKAPEFVRTEEWGSSTYSHMAYEKSLLRHVPTLRNYLSLIKNTVDAGYIKDKQPGEKAIIFAASVDMCTRITDHLKQAYPTLDVRRYVEQDPYENAIEADIRVTTVLSGGTALDIPNLSFGLLTTALDSIQGNIQALGRLRKRDGKMLFYFFTAENIPKHVKYAESKKILFGERAKTYREIASGQLV